MRCYDLYGATVIFSVGNRSLNRVNFKVQMELHRFFPIFLLDFYLSAFSPLSCQVKCNFTFCPLWESNRPLEKYILIQSSWEESVTTINYWGVVIAQWIYLCLPSCHPGFESQAHHLCFYQLIFELFQVEKTKINIKRRDWHILRKKVKKSLEKGQFFTKKLLCKNGPLLWII